MSLGTVLVTGATGFVGRAVCRALRSETRVIGLVRRRDSSLEVEQREVAGLDDLDGVARSLDGVDTVIHLAGRAHVMRETAEDPLDAFRRTNVDGTRTVLEQGARAGVRRFVLASSVKVMGEGRASAYAESDPPAPSDPYGVSKLEAESLVLHGPTQMHRSALRLPLVYGPGVKANMLQLFRWVDRGVPLPFGGIENRRSLVFVGNLVEAIRTVLLNPKANERALFVSDGADVSTPELVTEIGRALGRPARLVPAPRRLLRAVASVGDVLNRFARFPVSSAALDRLFGSLTVDTSAIRELGYSPPFALSDGLRETAQWYRTQSRRHAA